MPSQKISLIRSVRRRFYEIAASGPAPIGSEALMQIAELYRIEDDICRRPADERRTLRQEKSRPIVANLELRRGDQDERSASIKMRTPLGGNAGRA